MKTRELSPNAFAIRIIFLLLLIVLAITMKIISLFYSEATIHQSGQKSQVVSKEMICQLPEKTILLDGLAVAFKGATLWNESEEAVLRKAFLKKSVGAWTFLADDANTSKHKTGIQ